MATTTHPQALQPVELNSIADRVEIAHGVPMPRLGLGTSHAKNRDVKREITEGLKIGYRLIDTAAIYGNEREIGEALHASSVPRDEVFITTKVWNSDQGYPHVMRAFQESRERLGVDYVDLYLIHWPQRGLTGETWRALEDLRERGHVRAIGVCNFMPEDFAELFETAAVPPALNQFEFHPYMQRPSLQAYCRERGITMQAWAPILRGRVGTVPELVRIAARHRKSPAQVSIRWILQKGITTIPKSVHEERLRENADVFDFELSADEMRQIDMLDRGAHAG